MLRVYIKCEKKMWNKNDWNSGWSENWTNFPRMCYTWMYFYCKHIFKHLSFNRNHISFHLLLSIKDVLFCVCIFPYVIVIVSLSLLTIWEHLSKLNMGNIETLKLFRTMYCGCVAIMFILQHWKIIYDNKREGWNWPRKQYLLARFYVTNIYHLGANLGHFA